MVVTWWIVAFVRTEITSGASMNDIHVHVVHTQSVFKVVLAAFI